jgi:hypothetical protein
MMYYSIIYNQIITYFKLILGNSTQNKIQKIILIICILSIININKRTCI